MTVHPGAIAQPGGAAPASRKARKSYSTKRARRRIRVLFIFIIGLILALPLLYLVSASLMSDAQMTSYPPALVPAALHFGNYTAAWSYLTGRSVLNSVIFTVSVVALQWALCISGGLVIAKMRFRARNLFTGIYALSLFVPFVTTLIPTYVVADKLHMVNTYSGLIIPIVAQTGFGTLVFRQFIINLPDELIDAARVDGASWWTVLRRIIVPLARPATGAYAAISTLSAWNMYVWPLVIATTPSLQVLTEALAALGRSEYATVPQTVAMAADVIATAPMLLAFIVAQRTFIRGLSGTGVE